MTEELSREMVNKFNYFDCVMTKTLPSVLSDKTTSDVDSGMVLSNPDCKVLIKFNPTVEGTPFSNNLNFDTSLNRYLTKMGCPLCFCRLVFIQFNTTNTSGDNYVDKCRVGCDNCNYEMIVLRNYAQNNNY